MLLVVEWVLIGFVLVFDVGEVGGVEGVVLGLVVVFVCVYVVFFFVCGFFYVCGVKRGNVCVVSGCE